jgi:hypothetical protein
MLANSLYKENIDDISRKNISQSTLQQVPADHATA